MKSSIHELFIRRQVIRALSVQAVSGRLRGLAEPAHIGRKSDGVFVFEKCEEHRLQIKEQIPVLDVIKVMTDS